MGFEFTPEQQLVLAMEGLQSDVAEIKEGVKTQGSQIEDLSLRFARLEGLVTIVVEQVKLYAERRIATTGGPNWHRLTYDISKGIAIAVGTSIALSAVAIFIFGLCVRTGGNSC